MYFSQALSCIDIKPGLFYNTKNMCWQFGRMGQDFSDSRTGLPQCMQITGRRGPTYRQSIPGKYIRSLPVRSAAAQYRIKDGKIYGKDSDCHRLCQ